MEYTIYTDGGCSLNNKMMDCPGAYAFIITTDGDVEIAKECEIEFSTTNNRMELAAAIQGLSWLIGKKIEGLESHDCVVITDSKYLKDGYHEYLPIWKNNGWRKSDGSPVLNQDLWKMLSALSPEFNSLRFQWVRGHSNHRQNCEVDMMVQKKLHELRKPRLSESRKKVLSREVPV